MDRLTPVLRRRLVEYKRVVPRAGDAVAAGPATTLDFPAEAGSVEVPVTRKVCGDFGGRTKSGKPCTWVVRDGPCHMHRN